MNAVSTQSYAVTLCKEKYPLISLRSYSQLHRTLRMWDFCLLKSSEGLGRVLRPVSVYMMGGAIQLRRNARRCARDRVQTTVSEGVEPQASECGEHSERGDLHSSRRVYIRTVRHQHFDWANIESLASAGRRATGKFRVRVRDQQIFWGEGKFLACKIELETSSNFLGGAGRAISIFLAGKQANSFGGASRRGPRKSLSEVHGAGKFQVGESAIFLGANQPAGKHHFSAEQISDRQFFLVGTAEQANFGEASAARFFFGRCGSPGRNGLGRCRVCERKRRAYPGASTSVRREWSGCERIGCIAGGYRRGEVEESDKKLKGQRTALGKKFMGGKKVKGHSAKKHKFLKGIWQILEEQPNDPIGCVGCVDPAQKRTSYPEDMLMGGAPFLFSDTSRIEGAILKLSETRLRNPNRARTDFRKSPKLCMISRIYRPPTSCKKWTRQFFERHPKWRDNKIDDMVVGAMSASECGTVKIVNGPVFFTKKPMEPGRRRRDTEQRSPQK
ncbi:hypothetical protein B0H19DRAFT_1329539 [Mycena capillaripes]|nr:hypothetical protein B0H19DRAFT_1329539 [Mycena capillaripes]